MNALNVFLELLLAVAVIFFYGGFFVPHFRWRLWRWSVQLIALVLVIALVVVEVRAHPLAALVIGAMVSLLAYATLETRRHHTERARRPVSTPFLNLRMTGKTAADIPDDHPLLEHEDEEAE
jgi:MFS family permease